MLVGAVVGILFLLFTPAQARPGEALRVEAKVAQATTFAGQAIEVRVGVVAGAERPKVVPPKVDGAEVTLIDTTFRQLGASGIGDFVTETNIFVSRFRVIPARPGPLVVPPIYARVDDRSGSSTPIRLIIQPVPPEGRPASYLRGVGRIAARAEVTPSSARVGQTIDYRLILQGPGARGSIQWPLLSELEPLKNLKVEQVDTKLIADPPLRTFHYQIRPTSPGDLVLPSVAVATFDPTFRRYVETRAPIVIVRVVAVPKFDPSSLDTALPTIPSPTARRIPIAPIVVGGAIVALIAAFLVVRSRDRPRRLAIRLARGLRSEPDPIRAADGVASGLTAYLKTAIGRPMGVLTPEEGRRGVRESVGNLALADRAGRLIERCDRARFGRDTEMGSDLSVEASSFFEELATKRVQRSKLEKTEGGIRNRVVAGG